MPILSLVTLSPDLLREAEAYFSESYTATLRPKSTYASSIAARYRISRDVEHVYGVKEFLPIVDTAGRPVYETDICWSLSHSDGHILTGVSRGQTIGVDIETIVPRDPSVFGYFSDGEWGMLGSEKGWEGFYTLWTAKESVIKLHRGGIDDLPRYILSERRMTPCTVSGLDFKEELIFA